MSQQEPERRIILSIEQLNELSKIVGLTSSDLNRILDCKAGLVEALQELTTYGDLDRDATEELIELIHEVAKLAEKLRP
jgi:hypothetical protein